MFISFFLDWGQFRQLVYDALAFDYGNLKELTSNY